MSGALRCHAAPICPGLPFLGGDRTARDQKVGQALRAEAGSTASLPKSASKAFNLAGLKTAFFVAESGRMTKLVTSLPEEVTFRAGLFGLIVTRGQGWLRATIAAIEHNITAPWKSSWRPSSPRCGCAVPAPATSPGPACLHSDGEMTRGRSHPAARRWRYPTARHSGAKASAMRE